MNGMIHRVSTLPPPSRLKSKPIKSWQSFRFLKEPENWFFLNVYIVLGLKVQEKLRYRTLVKSFHFKEIKSFTFSFLTHKTLPKPLSNSGNQKWFILEGGINPKNTSSSTANGKSSKKHVIIIIATGVLKMASDENAHREQKWTNVFYFRIYFVSKTVHLREYTEM